jgi:hypothetical protein
LNLFECHKNKQKSQQCPNGLNAGGVRKKWKLQIRDRDGLAVGHLSWLLSDLPLVWEISGDSPISLINMAELFSSSHGPHAYL